ncbi:MAG: hypothetical protein ACRBBP_10705 [Bdellovibrionales bacterium]
MSLPDKCSWINNEDIRPYFFVRKDNWFKEPGSFLKDCNWFDGLEVLKRDPLSMKEEGFARIILEIESRAFQQSGMPMPGWVFYDCGLIPGIVTGFAYRTSKLPQSIRNILGESLLQTEWTPLSLFIAIPCGNKKEWVAHNLSSINALLPKEDRFYGLGFLSKSFGLWYSNIKQLCGMTQWMSPALKLHVNYGDFEILTSYTPVHSHPHTLTYRCALDFKAWERFFDKTADATFGDRFEAIEGLDINPKDRESLIKIQHLVEDGKGSFYLKPDEIRNGNVGDVLNIYKGL